MNEKGYDMKGSEDAQQSKNTQEYKQNEPKPLSDGGLRLVIEHREVGFCSGIPVRPINSEDEV